MTSVQYKRKLEAQLIKEFVQKFTDKIGYVPVILTDATIEEEKFRILTFEELDEIFEDFLPTLNNKKIRLHYKNRSHPIKFLRHIYCYIAKSMRYSLKSIGRHLGGRDHTTVIHSIRTFRDLYQTDDMFRDMYFKIIKKIKQEYESSNMEVIDKMEGES
jgi:chromosomal replication initiation ATPase DnaA